jgi:hypothetical protein
MQSENKNATQTPARISLSAYAFEANKLINNGNINNPCYWYCYQCIKNVHTLKVFYKRVKLTLLHISTILEHIFSIHFVKIELP